MHLSNYFANSRVKLFLSFFADVSSKTTHCFTFVSKHRCFQCIIRIVSKTRDKLYDIVSRNVKNEFDSVIPTVSIWRRFNMAIDQQQNIPFRIFTGITRFTFVRDFLPLERSYFISKDVIIVRT